MSNRQFQGTLADSELPSEQAPTDVVTFQISEREKTSIPCCVLTHNIGQYADYVGRGSFGTVYKYPKGTSSERTVALKQLYFGLNSSNSGRDDGRDDVMREVETHRKLIHPNIVRYIGCHETENVIFIVMEYLSQESLHCKLSSIENPSTPALPEATIFRYTKQILAGLVYLHSYTGDPTDQRAPVVHRDLRSVNILVDDNDTLKLADFGISKQLDILASQSNFNTAAIGNFYWRSPEMIMELKEKLGRKVDVWSLGITLLEMIFVDVPFIGLQLYKFMKIIEDRVMFFDLLYKHRKKIEGAKLLNLVDKCLTYEADERPTSLELHQYLEAQTSVTENASLQESLFQGKHRRKIDSAELTNLADKCLTYEADERPTSLEPNQYVELTEARNYATDKAESLFPTDDFLKALSDLNNYNNLMTSDDNFANVDTPGLEPVAELSSDSEGDIIPEFIVPAVFRADSDNLPTKDELFRSGEREPEGYAQSLVSKSIKNGPEQDAIRIDKHRKLISKVLPPYCGGVESREGSSKLSPVKGMQMLNLREDQGDVGQSAGSSSAYCADDITDSDTVCPWEGMNTVSDLNLHMQKTPVDHTSLRYNTTMHGPTSFSAIVQFTLNAVKKQFDSGGIHRTKKEAKKAAAYFACLDIGIISAPENLEATVTPSSSPHKPSPHKPSPIRNYKNSLQEKCQQFGVPVPVYKAENVGDANGPLFLATVTMTLANGISLQKTSDAHSTKKSAEFQAAKMALVTITSTQSCEPLLVNQDRTVVGPRLPLGTSTTTNWKNKLQELMQKNKKQIPVYTSAPFENGFVSTVTLRLDDYDIKKFKSDLRGTAKLADMNAAEKAHKALAENNADIRLAGRLRDFCDWQSSRNFPPHSFTTKATRTYPSCRFISKVRFYGGKKEVEGDEQSSKKDAENSAVLEAIALLGHLQLWDIES